MAWVSGIGVSPGQSIPLTVPGPARGQGASAVFGTFLTAGGGGVSLPFAGSSGVGGAFSADGGTSMGGGNGGHGGVGKNNYPDGGGGGCGGYFGPGGDGGGRDRIQTIGTGGGAAGGSFSDCAPGGGTGINGIGNSGTLANKDGSMPSSFGPFGQGKNWCGLPGQGVIRVIWGFNLSYPYNAPSLSNEVSV